MKKISTAKNEVITYTKQDVNINSPEQAKKELENRLALANKADYMTGWLLAELIHAVSVQIKSKNENYSEYKTLKDFVEDFGKISNGAASQLNGAYETREKILMMLQTTDLNIYWENVTNNCTYSYLYALKPLIDKSEHFEQYGDYDTQDEMLNDFVGSYDLTSGESVKELQKYIKEFLTIPTDEDDSDGDGDGDEDDSDGDDDGENVVEMVLRTVNDVNILYNVILMRINEGIPIKVNYHKFTD